MPSRIRNRLPILIPWHGSTKIQRRKKRSLGHAPCATAPTVRRCSCSATAVMRATTRTASASATSQAATGTAWSASTRRLPRSKRDSASMRCRSPGGPDGQMAADPASSPALGHGCDERGKVPARMPGKAPGDRSAAACTTRWISTSTITKVTRRSPTTVEPSRCGGWSIESTSDGSSGSPLPSVWAPGRYSKPLCPKFGLGLRSHRGSSSRSRLHGGLYREHARTPPSRQTTRQAGSVGPAMIPQPWNLPRSHSDG